MQDEHAKTLDFDNADDDGGDEAEGFGGVYGESDEYGGDYTVDDHPTSPLALA